jgi:hypothetical protein
LPVAFREHRSRQFLDTFQRECYVGETQAEPDFLPDYADPTNVPVASLGRPGEKLQQESQIGAWSVGGARNARGRSHRYGSQHGGGTIKAILWTAILIYGAFVAYKILPAYVAEYQLADKMQEQARFAVVNHYPEEQIRDSIFKVVKDLEIPVKREDIKITANQDVVKIACDYTVPVDLLVYQMNLHFTPSSENKNL